jgi:hypothetical protein
MWFRPATALPIMADQRPEPARLEALAALYARATVYLGPPSAAHMAAIAALAEPARLADLAARATEASSWDELLGLAPPQAAPA